MLKVLHDLALGLCPVAAFLLSIATFPAFIAWLGKRQVKQPLREEGPASHAGKASTPTMGGACFIVMFLIVFACGWMLSDAHDTDSIVVVLASLLCGGIGFADDFAKTRHKANKGISAYGRLAGEFVVGAVLGLCLRAAAYSAASITTVGAAHAGGGASLSGFTYHLLVDNWPMLVALSAFLVAATTNAVNLHDGMDGLAAGTSSLVFLTMAVMFFFNNQLTLALVAATAGGAILGFLVFNRYPARIFMGDTGSLFIGGLMAALVAASGTVLYFIPLSLIYIAEAVSVILQVGYFKLTKAYTPEKPMSNAALVLFKLTRRLPGEGKRLFRMSPLHHHFEAVLAEKGVKEWQVVAYFWVVQACLCGAVLAAFFVWR